MKESEVMINCIQTVASFSLTIRAASAHSARQRYASNVHTYNECSHDCKITQGTLSCLNITSHFENGCRLKASACCIICFNNIACKV